MVVEKGFEAANGVTSIERAFGARVSETRTFHKDIDDSVNLEDALEDALCQNAARASASVVGRRANGDIKMQVQISDAPYELGQIKWTFNVVSMQERTTTDVNGDPILVDFPDSLDWASTITSSGGDVFHSFQYTTYETQTGEAEKYVPCCEINGVRQVRVPAGGIINHLTNVIRPWFYTMNSAAFMGFEKGNVLCMGVDFDPVARRDDRSWICQERYKFMTRPGHPKSTEGAGAGGWNTWHPWKDPNSGVIPDSVWDEKEGGGYVGAVEVRHYAWKDFTVLYQYS
jgi:hypothetical protein